MERERESGAVATFAVTMKVRYAMRCDGCGRRCCVVQRDDDDDDASPGADQVVPARWEARR